MSVNSVNKTTGDTTLIAGSTLWADSPIGTILPYGGASAPSGWFICDGTAISRTTYSELFAVIGTSFGTGDGSTTFNLPDLREATTKGVGLTGKSNNHYDSDGVALGEFVEDRVQSHEHKIKSTTDNSELAQNSGISGSGASWIQSGTASGYIDKFRASTIMSGRYGDTTEVKAVGVNYIIKAKMVAMPSDFMSNVEEAVGDAFDTYQSGISTSINIDPNTINQFSVTFDTPMPDTDYVVIVNTNGGNGGLFASVWNKVKTGFSVTIYNANQISITNQSFEWRAFKIPH